MCPRYRLTIHKKQTASCACARWHPAVKPSAHTTEAGKTARRWIEEQVRSRCRADRPARYSDTAAVEIPAPAAPYSLHKTR
ncbi:unnamed protein product [Staurois parvus]|uniref:Uncharacterized protein n=1 Tax=Staurois parvus TaxID=386267 RepID=A0ABN9CBL2_9NEOB|nr:unnamed protein product [Staurois parvus]